MGQRPYLPHQTTFHLAGEELGIAMTAISYDDTSEYRPLRPFDEDYREYYWARGGRALGLTGVYYGAKGRAVRAVFQGNAEALFRVVEDHDQDRSVYAGHVVLGNYTLTVPVQESAPLVVNGTGPVSGVPYAGTGVLNAVTTDTARADSGLDTAIILVTAAVVPDGTTARIALRGSAGGNTWTRTIEYDEPGLYLITIPEQSDAPANADRPTMGDMVFDLVLTGFTGTPTLEWSLVGPEGGGDA